MGFWSNKSVVVTGGAGFLGSAIVRKLKQINCHTLFAPRSREFDLRQRDQVDGLFQATQPDIVIHAAGLVGGIAANVASPGSFFYDNAVMGIHVIEAARKFGLAKLILIGTVCSYPREAVVLREEGFWDGYPDEANAAYGLAKKMLLAQAQAYRAQYGLNVIYLILANLYGPGETFDSENSHATAAIIEKCVEARARGDDEIILWGNGRVTRDFLYVEDAAQGILKAAEHYDGGEPVNLGTQRQTSIRTLTRTISELTGFSGTIVWDTTKPSGQPRRMVDTAKAAALFGFKAKTFLREGLTREIEWYQRSNS